MSSLRPKGDGFYEVTGVRVDPATGLYVTGDPEKARAEKLARRNAAIELELAESAFLAEWHRANREGDVENRVRRGLLAAGIGHVDQDEQKRDSDD